MATVKRPIIEIETIVRRPVQQVWTLWTSPEHITQWNAASDEWYCPAAENEVREGGAFSWRMEAKDGSMGFDFAGTYQEVHPPLKLVSKLEDGREIVVEFTETDEGTHVNERFEADSPESLDMERAGWQAILDRFKRYAENLPV
jgi:uncharacterized protein YndB with AHSA1/START domain